MTLRLREDLLDAEPRVLREREVADAVAADVLLVAHDEVLQEVDGVVLVRREVRVAVDGQEAIATERVRAAAGTYTSRLERYLEANIVAVSCWRAPSPIISAMGSCKLIIISARRRGADKSDQKKRRR